VGRWAVVGIRWLQVRMRMGLHLVARIVCPSGRFFFVICCRHINQKTATRHKVLLALVSHTCQMALVNCRWPGFVSPSIVAQPNPTPTPTSGLLSGGGNWNVSGSVAGRTHSLRFQGIRMRWAQCPGGDGRRSLKKSFHMPECFHGTTGYRRP